MTRRGVAVAAIGLALAVALSAQGAWRAVVAHGGRGIPALPAATGYEAEDHFPGAASLYAAAGPSGGEAADAAPARGVTGTTALPPIALSAAAVSAAMRADAGIVAAAPFSMKGASSLDRARALACLTAAIYYEAASEPDAGQSAVAQVILNRARHPAFPATVCGVVYQGSEKAGCQFSFACDGAMARVPARSAWIRAARHAGMALSGYVFAPVGLATHYHTYAVTPAWNRGMVMTDVVGAHLFHRWKGFWGTSAAFRPAYRGGEPVPGPHVPVLLPPVVAADPVAAVAAVVPAAPAAVVVAGRQAEATLDTLPPASTVLDKWKDSGKPLY